MNQSVISRMNLVIDLDEPDEDTQVERAMAVTGCKDAKTVRLMTRIVKSMAVYCRENLITDGCCGMRELISWVQSYMVCGDIREAATRCLPLPLPMLRTVRKWKKAVWILCLLRRTRL